MRAVLITGTDTGVGKTFISYNLAYALKEKGIKVGYLKPVETDVKGVPQDGSLLVSITGQSVREAVPITFSLPLSPYAGILEEKKDFSLEELRNRYESMKKAYDFLIVEGAGGIAVPIKKGYDYAKLAKEWELPIIIVARAGLGTINHTFLTYFYAKSMGIDILGIVMNGFEGKDISERTNPKIIEELTGIRPVEIPKVDNLLLPSTLREALLRFVGV